MKLYTYIVASDTGFAPHPFDNYLSLACCKPVIRRTAKIKDWIIGLGSVNNVGNEKIIYAMEVTEKIHFNDYYKDKRFKNRADNIYHISKGEWKQKENNFHNENDIKHDTNTEFVLISDNYYYFGKNAIPIPDEFKNNIKGGRGHRNNYSGVFIHKVLAWLKENYSPGIYAKPCDYKKELWNKNRCSL